MYSPSRDAYFETQINTATPQRLRLMLIDGAIRFANQTAAAWESGDTGAGLEALIRCRDIVGELLAGVRDDGSPLTRQVSGLYVFLFQTLTSAQLACDAGQLASVIGILQTERETWQQVCEQQPERPTESAAALTFAPVEELAPQFVSQPSAFSLDA